MIKKKPIWFRVLKDIIEVHNTDALSSRNKNCGVAMIV